MAGEAGTAGATLAPEELEEAIVLALSETLRAMHEALGDRQLTDDEAVRLAGGLAQEVSVAVAQTLDMSAEQRDLVAGHLQTELTRVLTGHDADDRDLAGVGPARA